MNRRRRYQYQVMSGFLSSLLVGFWTYTRDDGELRLRMTLLSSLLSAVGLLMGYKLAERRYEQT